MRTIFGAALRQHALDPRAPAALATPSGDLSYAELAARVDRCAAWLVREGCAASVPVAVSVLDEIDSLVVTLALLDLGVPQVGLSTHTPEAMRLALARRIAVGRVVVDDPQHALPGFAASVLTSEALRGRAAVEPVALDADPEAIAMFASSSGTTGQPKILALSQRVFTWRARQAAQTGAFARDERVLVPMSNQEYPGKSVRLYTLFHGGTAVHWPGAGTVPSPTAYCVAMDATTLQLTVLQARALALDDGSRDRLPPTTRVLLGSAQMPAGLPARFEARVGGRVHNRYGTMEIGIIASMHPDGDDGTPDSVGRPVAGIEIEIVDAAGVRQPADVPGEIRVRGGGMVHGYVDDADATARHFADGWFHPRDVGAITTAGVLRFLGRSDDMMSLNGINIFPVEIERVLETHPAVRNAAAFPLRSPLYGDIPVAAVELNDEARTDAQALTRYARERLGARAPRKVVVLERLPRNAAGKVLKRDLAAMLASRPRDR